MKSTKFLKTTLITTISLLLVFSYLTSIKSARAGDAAVRAFDGISSLKVDLPESDQRKFYVLTFAKFVDGKFSEYAKPLVHGLLLANSPNPSIELAWKSTESESSYVLVVGGSSRGVKIDSFFSNFTSHQTSSLSSNSAEFDGFRILGYAANTGKTEPVEISLDSFEADIQSVPFAVALLYKDFTEKEAFLEFIESFDKR